MGSYNTTNNVIITRSLYADYSCARFSDYTLYGIITGPLCVVVMVTVCSFHDNSV